MPEMKRVFTSGKMNKDLDERLVQNGEYTDALNVQVAASEDNNIGAIENVLGNQLRNLDENGSVWSSFIPNAKCIGVVKKDSSEKIYWFVTSPTVDAIIEYDQPRNVVAPILVDTNNVLNFSSSHLITGVNIVENLILWTDNNSEPRKINIDTFKAGSSDFSTHTTVYGRGFVSSDVSVIKRAPIAKPTLTMRSTQKLGSGIGCGINKITTNHNFTTSTGAFFQVKEVGETVYLVYNTLPDWAAGDIISLSASKINDNNFVDEFKVRVEVVSISSTSPYTVTAEIVTISSNILAQTYEWTSVLEENPPMFEFKFPRFAYRWKYADGEYSTFSPFSKVAFIGDSFQYKSSKAHNLGMINNIRYLDVNSFETPPDEVIEVDVLYKESNSTNVYKVDSIAPGTSSLVIESELIGNVLPANQLLRPWDNVPIKAKAQEIIGNRVVYGNYVQNLDMSVSGSPVKPDLAVSLSVGNHSSVGDPELSLKSMRTYQIGVVYGDEYGRETPVFTNNGASVVNPKKNADNVTYLQVDIESAAPDFAEYFKIFVKETSNEYYNIALDRFYKADDGNVWLSFPSAERNKLQVGDYMTLKKEHDTDVAVVEDARYRILDISNNAPADVVKVRSFEVANQVTMHSSGPSVGAREVEFHGPTQDEYAKFFEAFDSTVLVRFWQAGNVSDFYELDSGGFSGEDTTHYRLTLKSPLGDDASWMSLLANNDVFNVQVYNYKDVYKKEYQGKFFVKINRDPSFDEYIINPLVQDASVYNIMYGSFYIEDAHFDDPGDSLKEPSTFAYGEYGTTSTPGKPNQSSDTFWISYAPHTSGVSQGNIVTQALSSNVSWFDNGLSAGRFIKFVADPSGKYYKIESVSTVCQSRYGTTSPFGSDDAELVKTITLTEPIEGNPDSWVDANFKIYMKSTNWTDILDADNVVLSSSNPAIFETEPKEAIDINLYYEATDGIDISSHGSTTLVDWSNCYSFGNGVESNRVRDDFNAVTIDKGPRVSSILEEPYDVETKGSSLIFSGIFNSVSGVNNLNQFLMAEDITKDFNPVHGTVQKLHARDTDLITLCEDKVFRVLADKDALYNADGNANLTATNRVLGQSVPYVGEYGISQNPESFASYGFRAYFTDKNRGVVLRLSRDGLTEISAHGMSDYLKRNLSATNTAIGSYDDYSNLYHLTINNETISFNDRVDGWTSRKSFIPEAGVSMNNVFYTFKTGHMWSHDNTSRSNFYGTQYKTSVQFVYNDDPSRIKNFKTLSYEGTSGWICPLILTDSQDGEVEFFKNKEGIWYNYIKGLATTWDPQSQAGSLDTREFSVQGIDIAEYVEDNTPSVTIGFVNPINVSIQSRTNDIVMYKSADDGRIYIVGQCMGIDHTNKTITCTLAINGTVPEENDFIFFAKSSEINTSGIIGYYGRVDMEVTSSSFKELFAVNSEIFISS